MQPKIAFSSGVPMFCLGSMHYWDLSAPKVPPSVFVPKLSGRHQTRAGMNTGPFPTILKHTESGKILIVEEQPLSFVATVCMCRLWWVGDGAGQGPMSSSLAEDGSNKALTPMFLF